jgi:4-hydroxybenzoate polyprenyltransferase
MKKLIAYLKLVRWINLVIVALSMYLFQFCVIRLYIDAAESTITLNWFYFSLLVLATVLIAAAGNVVNAYFDYEQDMEYKPEKVVIGKEISLDAAFNLQMGLNVAGVLIGFFLAYHVGNLKLGYVFISCATLLWVYSQFLKKSFLIGNLVIALLSALVFVLPVLFEQRLFSIFKTDFEEMATDVIVMQLKWYFIFAFIVSLIREIVKDAEDREADAAYGMNTLPVALPLWATNAVIVSLFLVTMAAVAVTEVYFWKHGLKKHFWYSIFFIQFQLVTNMFTVVVSKRKQDYHNISVLLKVLMFFGVASLPLYYCFVKIWR